MKTGVISLCLVPILVGEVLGHGSMVMPPSRNSVDAELDAWSNNK